MPAPKIDRALVEHVAKLASLSLTSSEIERFASELGRIVAHVEMLETVDTRDVPPTAHVAVDRLPERPDLVAPCLDRDEVLSQAPEVEAGGFAVPAFFE